MVVYKSYYVINHVNIVSSYVIINNCQVKDTRIKILLSFVSVIEY